MYRRLILFLHFTFCILHSASAGIVSDDSKMFFSGGDWLPDTVPNSAIYDSTDISSKELRITTNVTAALYSTVSAFLERIAVERRWEFQQLSDFKTNTIMRNVWWGYPSNRVIRTARLLEGPPGTGESYIGTCRDFLSRLANSTVTPWMDGDYWGSSKLDDQIGAAAKFPEFGWFNGAFEDNTNAFRQVFADDAYPSIWPEYQSCSNDPAWKVEGSPVRHTGLCEAMELFHYGDFYPAMAFDPVEWNVQDTAVYTNPSPASCYRILTDRFGDHASAITNATRRLSYYQLGTVEAGIASVDTEYMRTRPEDGPYKIYQLSHAHSRSGIARATVTNATVGTDGTVEFSMPPLTWQDTESWSVTTNKQYGQEFDTSDQPNYALLSDSSSIAGHISASTSIRLSYYDLSRMLSCAVDYCGVDEFSAYAYVYSASPPTLMIEFWAAYSSSYYSESQAFTVTELSLTCTVAASRGAVVRKTGDVWEREDVSDTYPYWSWSRDKLYIDTYLPEIQLIACETRYGARNDSPYSGDEPDWGKDPYYHQRWPGDTYYAYTQRLDFRAVNAGAFTSPNLCLGAWRRERLRFRDAISSYAASFGGVNLESRESVAGFPASVLSSLKGQMPTSCRGTLGADHPGRVFSAQKTDDAIIIDGSPFTPGDLLHVADVDVAIDDPHLSASMPSNTLFTVTGTCQPATRVRWRFKNLHEE